MWSAEKRAETYLNSLFETQKQVANLPILGVGHDVARQVFEKAGELFSIGMLDHKMWERNFTQGATIARDDPRYRRSICEWLPEMLVIVLGMGPVETTAPTGYSQIEHNKEMSAIFAFKMDLQKTLKQCLSELEEHGVALKELYRAWSERMRLESLYPLLSVKPNPAYEKLSELGLWSPKSAEAVEAHDNQTTLDAVGAEKAVKLQLDQSFDDIELNTNARD